MIYCKTLSEFDSIIKKPSLTVVDFYADWCGPCKQIAPKFEQLSTKFPSVNFVKVNVDEAKEIASKYSVRAMPTFLFFKNGTKVNEVVGADIYKVESIIAISDTKFQGKGYTLKGKVVENQGGDRTTFYMIAGVVGLLVYLHLTK